MLLLSTIVVLLSFCTESTYAKKDRNAPHPHNGKLKPYTPGPFPNLKLSKEDTKTLEAGQSVMKQIMPDRPEDSGSAICVQDVNAPCTAVWHQILDMDSYTKKVSKVTENKNYVVQKNGPITTIKTKQVLGVLPGYSVRTIIFLIRMNVKTRRANLVGLLFCCSVFILIFCMFFSFFN